jgi:hypothetical protein
MIVQIYSEQYRVHWPRKPVPVYLRYGMFSAREVSTNWSTKENEK